MARLYDFFIVLTAAGLLLSCGQPGSVAAGSRKVEIAPPQATIKPLGRQRFSAVAKDAGGNVISDAILGWTSTNPAIVGVDATGLATGLSEGAAQVGAGQWTGSGGQISPLALASLRVTQTASRPVEIINVVPFEDEVVSFIICPDCLMPAPPGGVSVTFLFSNGDVAESARLVLNNTDVSGAARLISQLFPDFPSRSGEGLLGYTFSQIPPPAGLYSVTVELRSKQGKLVSYSWSFTVP